MNIDNLKQNKPSLIAFDLLIDKNIPFDYTMEVLLNRGVFKWFAVRRRLIVLKNIWKDHINITLSLLKRRDIPIKQREYLKGYLKAKEECRAEVRKLCHSPRLQAPDNDKKARDFLSAKEA